MKTGILIAMLPVLLSAGCCNMYKNRVNQQLWERELRLEENCIYQLRWQLEDKQRRIGRRQCAYRFAQSANRRVERSNHVGSEF